MDVHPLLASNQHMKFFLNIVCLNIYVLCKCILFRLSRSITFFYVKCMYTLIYTSNFRYSLLLFCCQEQHARYIAENAG